MRALSVLAGMLLGAICLAGLRIDILNNWHYGATVSHELAGVLVLAAIGVGALPAVAGMKGWSWLYGLGTAGCVILTVMAAFLAYTARQGEVAAARQTSADGYESARRDEVDARRDEGEARAEAAAISESASVDELVLLVEAAKAKAGREEGRGGCLGKCEAAKDAYAALIGKLGQAKAKAAALDRAEAARQRVQAAQGRAKGGSAPLPMSAIWIAAQTSRKAAEVAQSIDIGFALLSILVTQIFAALGHPAVKLIMWGVEQPKVEIDRDLRPAPASLAPPRPKPAPKPRLEIRKPRASRKPPVAVVDPVKAWAADSLIGRPGASVGAGEVHTAFLADTGAELSQTAFGSAMAEIGFNKTKRGGKVIYTGVAFKQAVRLAAANYEPKPAEHGLGR